MYDISTLKTLIEKGEIQSAIQTLDQLLVDQPTNDTLFYLRGNAYRKEENWQRAIENYLEAIALNPDSPAAEAHAMLIDILDFYNKDMYNQ